MACQETFCRHLRYALNHLYEPDLLRGSPLLDLLLSPQEVRAPLALSHLLTEAIESLKPAPGSSPEARGSRVYELLFYRYVHCASQADLARQLAVSVRQLRREQSQALQVLAEHLRRRHNLIEPDIASLDGHRPAPAGSSEVVGALSRELRWVQEGTPDASASLPEELAALQAVAGPLGERYGVRLEMVQPDPLPLLAVPPVALRQALLSLLTVAIHAASPGAVSLRVAQHGWRAQLAMRARRAPLRKPQAHEDSIDSQKDAEALLLLCGGSLTMARQEDGLTIDVELPLQSAVPVLVIDDNRDALQLLERYVAGTRYRLITSHDPKQALSIVEKELPALIVIDIMMAGLDGWQLLRRLREHQASAACPVIVCTVLAQQEVAASQGAKDFIHKPVSRQAFLQALDRQYVALGKGPGPGSPQHPASRETTGHRGG